VEGTERLAERLRALLERLGLSIHGETAVQLVAYGELVWQGQARARLTGATSLEELVTKHIVDCATLWLVEGVEWDGWIDVGSGAGLPGLVLAVGRPEGQGTLLEATGKKADFLRQAVTALGLEARLQVVHGRAEEWGRGPGRERYRVAVARAVAPARVLAEYLLPLVEVDGVAVMMKGPQAEAELAEAERALHVLGGRVERVHRLTLPEDQGERRLVVVRKDRPTPEGYPRRAGLPAKRPL